LGAKVQILPERVRLRVNLFHAAKIGSFLPDQYHGTHTGSFLPDQYRGTHTGSFLPDQYYGTHTGSFLPDQYHGTHTGSFLPDQYHVLNLHFPKIKCNFVRIMLPIRGVAQLIGQGK